MRVTGTRQGVRHDADLERWSRGGAPPLLASQLLVAERAAVVEGAAHRLQLFAEDQALQRGRCIVQY